MHFNTFWPIAPFETRAIVFFRSCANRLWRRLVQADFFVAA
jgi:hypothetical protein